MANIPQYANTPRCEVTELTVANPNLDGTGTLEDAFVAGPNGSRIEMLLIKAAGVTTSGMVRLFLDDGSGAKLFVEIPVVAGTPSGSAPAFDFRMITVDPNSFIPLIIPAGTTVKASTENAESINLLLMGGDF